MESGLIYSILVAALVYMILFGRLPNSIKTYFNVTFCIMSHF